MAVIDSLKRSFLVSSVLTKEVNASKREVSNVKTSIDNISRIVESRTKVKSDLISKSTILENRRREADRRREIEDSVSASKISTSPSRGLLVAQSSGQGPLGRILTFLGFLGAGWILENLPTWIAIGKEFIKRVRLAGQILFNFVNNVGSVIGAFGNLLSSAGKNIISLDLFDSSDRIKNSFDELIDTTETLGSQIREGFIQLMQPLGIQVPGLEEQRPEADQRPESPASSGGGGTEPPPPPGSRYNISQLVGLAQRAGFKGENAAVAAAVAMAESGGNTNAHNTKYPDNSYGLWQINMLDEPGYMLGAERRKKFNLKSNNELFNPVTNASVAYKLSGGSNFGAWSTYNDGLHIPFLPAARKALSNPQAPPRATVSSQPSGTRQPPQQQGRGSQPTSGKIVQYLHGERGRAGYEPKGHWNHDHFSFTTRAAAVKAFEALRAKGFKPYEFEGYTRVGKHSATGGHFGPVGGKPTYNDTSDGTAFDIPYSSYGSGPIGPKDYAKSREAYKIVMSAIGGSSSAESQPPPTPQAQVSSAGTGQQLSQEITPERRGQEIVLLDDPRPSYGGGSGLPAPSMAPSGGGVTKVSQTNMLNNFIKNKLLLDLAYL
jgi:hypothetical protein